MKHNKEEEIAMVYTGNIAINIMLRSGYLKQIVVHKVEKIRESNGWAYRIQATRYCNKVVNYYTKSSDSYDGFYLFSGSEKIK